MAQQIRDDLRNLAIIAHVDHGKTSLVDAMLWQSEMFRRHEYEAQRVLDSLDLEREKRITILPKMTSMLYRGTRINVLDIPGHTDLAGAVERTLKMVEGVILLVDACEGPLPQTRYVLRKALEAGLAPIVVISKIDLPGARPEAVLQAVRDLFVDLDASRAQLKFPVLYCNAVKGLCRREPDEPDRPLMLLFEDVLRTIPAPRFNPESRLQFLITSLDYDDYLGRMALGRVYNGELTLGQEVAHCRLDGSVAKRRVTGLYGCEGFRRVEVERAHQGDIVSLTGVESAQIGESLADAEKPEPLPPIKVEEPTLTVELSVNNSPTAGLEATHTDGRKLRERLWGEILTNASVRVEETDSPDAFRLSGRGELQLVILIEMMRREGYEMLAGRPEVLTHEVDGKIREPMEMLVVDFPEAFIGVVTEKVGARRGRMTKMVNHGTGRVRMEFRLPSRGLIGFRPEFLSDTRGTGILHHLFDGHDDWQGEIAHRKTGSLVAEHPGRASAAAIEHLQARGTIFVGPDEEVYAGMVVGENSNPSDLEVDITKDSKPAKELSEYAKPAGRLLPPRSMSLEQALEFLGPDELLEITPRALRVRKKLLSDSRLGRKS
jgi:GTP-binding protein